MRKPAQSSGRDVLIHDGQYIETERPLAALYGHCTVDEAIDLATRSAVRRLVMTHHATHRTEVELDAMLSACQSGERSWIFARAGLALDVRGA
jgi:ribonuclease BN (tRNA processing enzyme)